MFVGVGGDADRGIVGGGADGGEEAVGAGGGGAGVDHDGSVGAADGAGVVEELDVSGLEVHLEVEGGVVCDGLKEFHGFNLGAGEAGDRGVALGVADVPADVEDAGCAVDIGERGERKVGVLAGGLFVVAVPVHGLVEHVEKVWPLAEQLVVDGGRAGDSAFATGADSVEAEEADEVCVVIGAVRGRGGRAGSPRCRRSGGTLPGQSSPRPHQPCLHRACPAAREGGGRLGR